MSDGGPRIRTWFFRNLLEAAEREFGGAAIAGVPTRVPPRLRPHVTLERLRGTSPLDTIALDEGEEAVLALEQALGDASGRLLERIAGEMFGRQLAQAVGVVRVGDLFGTVARLRGPLEHPFVDAALHFELTKTSSGFCLTLGVVGRSRSTRVLGHLAVAAVHASERFAREANADPLRVELEVFADRARIDVRFRRASTIPPPSPLPVSVRRSSGATRLVPSLSDEVARILDHGRAPERVRVPDEGPRSRSEPAPPPSESPSRRASQPPPAEGSEPRPNRPSTRPPPDRS